MNKLERVLYCDYRETGALGYVVMYDCSKRADYAFINTRESLVYRCQFHPIPKEETGFSWNQLTLDEALVYETMES